MKHRKKSKRTSKPARRLKAKAKASPASPLRVVLLGAPLTLTYKHAAGGHYRHKFGRGARVSVTPDGRHLVIDGIEVKRFIEG